MSFRDLAQISGECKEHANETLSQAEGPSFESGDRYIRDAAMISAKVHFETGH